MGPIVNIQVARLQAAGGPQDSHRAHGRRARLARPGRLRSRLRRPAAQAAIQKYLQDPLADKILAGEIKDGQSVRVDEGEGGLIIIPADDAVREAAENNTIPRCSSAAW